MKKKARPTDDTSRKLDALWDEVYHLKCITHSLYWVERYIKNGREYLYFEWRSTTDDFPPFRSLVKSPGRTWAEGLEIMIRQLHEARTARCSGAMIQKAEERAETLRESD